MGRVGGFPPAVVPEVSQAELDAHEDAAGSHGEAIGAHAQIAAAHHPVGVKPAYAQIVADSDVFVGVEEDIIGLAVTITPAAGRRIRVTVDAGVRSTVPSDNAELRIQEGATVLARRSVRLAGSADDYSLHFSVVLTPTAAAHTYKVTGIRTSGTGNILVDGDPTHPSYIMAEDIGPV